MLKPVPMAKVAVVGPKSRLEPTIDALHELGLLHIEDYQPGETGFDLGSPLPEGSKISERLLRVRGLMKSARMEAPTNPVRFTPENLRALQSKLSEVEAELSHLVDQRGKVVDETKRLADEEAVLQRVRNLPVPLELTHGYRSLATVTGFVPPGTDLAALHAADPNVEILTSAEAEGTFVLAFAPRAAERRLQEAAGQVKLAPLELPQGRGRPSDRLAAIAAERARLQSREADLESKLATIRERHAAAFYALDEYLSLQADKTAAPVRFRTTRNAFVIEGWVPRSELPRLKTSLGAATANQAFVTELPSPATQPWKHDRPAHDDHKEPHPEGVHDETHDPPPEEEPPVQLEYGRARGGYQLLTDTYSRPKYHEIDPTLFFYVGFPFFYGMMLGDIGYGIVLLLLIGFGVFDKVYRFFGFESRGALNKIFRHCAYMSILFGLLYTEFFGLELLGPAGVYSHYETHFGPIPYPLSRFHNVKLLLLLSLAIAAVHMAIGLILGIKNASDAHGPGHAWKHRGGWLFVLLGATFAGAAALPGVLAGSHVEPGHFDPVAALVVHHPAPLYALGGLLFAVGLVLLLMGEGGMAMLELPTILSNLLSYTRLVAIGLSSAGIALAGNKVSQLAFGDGGVGGWVGAVLILAFFHGLNLALGVLGPALHSLRLHYVEFFTKFYEGGGKNYAPFRAERRYTTKEVKQA